MTITFANPPEFYATDPPPPEIAIVDSMITLFDDGKHWEKGETASYVVVDGEQVWSYCLLGGIGQVVANDPEAADEDLMGPQVEDVIYEVTQTIQTRFMDRLLTSEYRKQHAGYSDTDFLDKLLSPQRMVAVFNDHVDTTYEDVELVLLLTRNRLAGQA